VNNKQNLKKNLNKLTFVIYMLPRRCAPTEGSSFDAHITINIALLPQLSTMMITCMSDRSARLAPKSLFTKWQQGCSIVLGICCNESSIFAIALLLYRATFL
jgi:hypothetical protein